MGAVVFLFVVGGLRLIGFGAMVMSQAPAVTQEMAGILLILSGIVATGFGIVIAVLHDTHESKGVSICVGLILSTMPGEIAWGFGASRIVGDGRRGSHTAVAATVVEVGGAPD